MSSSRFSGLAEILVYAAREAGPHAIWPRGDKIFRAIALRRSVWV